MNRIIAIPSNGSELEDQISEHFGHCNYFVQYNIKLYKGITGTLRENMDLLVQGKLQPLNEPICKGH